MPFKLSEIDLDEVSLVDRGANPHASIVLMKRDVQNKETENDLLLGKSKGVTMTDAERIAKYEVDAAVQKAEADKLKSDIAAANAATEVQKAAAARLETVNKLSAEDRAAYDALAPADHDTFHKADTGERTRLLATKKNTGPTPIEKRLEELEKSNVDLKRAAEAATTKAIAAEAFAKVEREKREDVEFAKRADDEFSAIAGTTADKAKVLKSISTLPKEEAEEIEKLLRSHNEAMVQLGKGSGTSRSNSGGSVMEMIEKKAEALVVAHKITKEKAIEKVLDEDPTLYERYEKEESRRAN